LLDSCAGIVSLPGDRKELNGGLIIAKSHQRLLCFPMSLSISDALDKGLRWSL